MFLFKHLMNVSRLSKCHLTFFPKFLNNKMEFFGSVTPVPWKFLFLGYRMKPIHMVGMLIFGIKKPDKGDCPRHRDTHLLPPAGFLTTFTCIVDSVPFAEASPEASFPQKFRAQGRLVRNRD